MTINQDLLCTTRLTHRSLGRRFLDGQKILNRLRQVCHQGQPEGTIALTQQMPACEFLR
jgi:hypothetical protein